MAASETKMAALHELTAELLMGVLRDGVPIVEKDTGEIVGYAPAPAPYFAAAIKFLKDNGIEALPTENSKLKDLSDSLPDFNSEEPLHAKH